MSNKFILVFFCLSFGMEISCHYPIKEEKNDFVKIDSNKIDKNSVLKYIPKSDYDSITFFKDVLFAGYKGMERFSNSDTLSFPFTAFCYKKDTTSCYIFFSKEKIVARQMQKRKDIYFFKVKRTSRETGKAFSEVTFFINDTTGLLVSFNEEKDLLFNDVKVRYFTIYNMSQKNILKINWYKTSNAAAIKLNELLEKVKMNNQGFNYIDHTEDILEMKDCDIYRIYRFVDYKVAEIREENSDFVLQTKDAFGCSFFYYFLTIVSD